jgi:hypothetical protein
VKKWFRDLDVFWYVLALIFVSGIALAQIGPFSGPTGSQATAPLVPSQGQAAAQVKSTAAPTGTSSTTPVMCGCGVQIQPAQSGTINAQFTFSITNGTATDGAAVQIAFGQGTPPANAAAPVGTTVGSVHTWVGGTTTSGTGIATVTGLIPAGLINPTVSTGPYWVDLQFKAVTGGTATLTAVDAIAFEM